jgi:hypothetical protein
MALTFRSTGACLTFFRAIYYFRVSSGFSYGQGRDLGIDAGRGHTKSPEISGEE